MGKALVYLSIVISLATAGLGFVNKSKLKQATADAASANRFYADAKAALDAAKGEIKSAKSSAESARGLVDAATGEKKAALDKAAQMEASSAKAQDEIAALQGRLQQMETELTKLKTERQQSIAQTALSAPAQPVPPATPQSPSAKPAAKESGPAAPKSPAPDYEKLIAEKDAAIRALQAQLAARKSGSAPAPAAAAGLNGRVLSVNEPWKIAVIDIGSTHGVTRNAELSVLDREDVSRPAGRLRVTLVEPNSSIVEIVDLPASGAIAPGDFAVAR